MTTKTTKAVTRKVLIIEDEGDLCLLLNILLDGKDFEVDHVPTLKKAAEYLLQEAPAIVLLDNRFPTVSALTSLVLLKNNIHLQKLL